MGPKDGGAPAAIAFSPASCARSLPGPRGRAVLSTDTAASTDVTAAPPRGATLVLLIVAIVQAVGAFISLFVLFDGDPSIPGTTPGGILISGTIMLAPPVAAVALVLAARGNVAGAVIAVAVLGLLDWLSYWPSIVNFSDEFPGSGFEGVYAILKMIVLPVLGVAAIVLAIRRERLGLAAVFAVLPTLLNAVSVIAFAISVSIYGF
jgi:hypothetical protein